MSTGQAACCATWCEQLPSNSDATPDSPRVPMTMTSNTPSATSTMVRHADAVVSSMRASASRPRERACSAPASASRMARVLSRSSESGGSNAGTMPPLTATAVGFQT
jgi:hypothetical protein